MEQARTAIATEEAGFILVPAVARDEIGQLTFYLEQGLRSLRDIAEHLRGSSGNMPSVLDDLKEVVKMTEAATVGLKASLLPKINVALGSKEKKSLVFTNADIQAQTFKPVRSGLGLQLGSLSIAQKLLFNPVDDLLEDLGLHIAEADVKVIEATCGSVGLVH